MLLVSCSPNCFISGCSILLSCRIAPASFRRLKCSGLVFCARLAASKNHSAKIKRFNNSFFLDRKKYGRAHDPEGAPRRPPAACKRRRSPMTFALRSRTACRPQIWKLLDPDSGVPGSMRPQTDRTTWIHCLRGDIACLLTAPVAPPDTSRYGRRKNLASPVEVEILGRRREALSLQLNSVNEGE